MPEDEIKYAVYVVVIEDTNELFERLAEHVDSYDGDIRGLTYRQAIELMSTLGAAGRLEDRDRKANA